MFYIVCSGASYISTFYPPSITSCLRQKTTILVVACAPPSDKFAFISVLENHSDLCFSVVILVTILNDGLLHKSSRLCLSKNVILFVFRTCSCLRCLLHMKSMVMNGMELPFCHFLYIHLNRMMGKKQQQNIIVPRFHLHINNGNCHQNEVQIVASEHQTELKLMMMMMQFIFFVSCKRYGIAIYHSLNFCCARFIGCANMKK